MRRTRYLMTEKTLLQEDNLISLRTAFVLDDGYEVSLVLTPRCLTTSVPGTRDCSRFDVARLYRRRRPLVARLLFLPLGRTQRDLFRWSNPSGKKRGFWAWVGYFG